MMELKRRLVEQKLNGIYVIVSAVTCKKLSLIKYFKPSKYQTYYILITNQESFMQKLFQSNPKDKCNHNQLQKVCESNKKEAQSAITRTLEFLNKTSSHENIKM